MCAVTNMTSHRNILPLQETVFHTFDSSHHRTVTKPVSELSENNWRANRQAHQLSYITESELTAGVQPTAL